MWKKKGSQFHWQNLIKKKNYGFRIFREKKNNLTIGQNSQSLLIMMFISFVLLGAIGSRLFFLQLVEGKNYRGKSENNRVRVMPKPPIRGTIFDRKGRILASNRFSHSVYLWPVVVSQPNWPKNRKSLAHLLSISEENIEARISESINKKTGYSSSILIKIASRLNPAQITALEEFKEELDGLEMDIENIRNYPNKEIGAHILGYIGELSSQELKEKQSEGYLLGDSVGRMGIESAYEKKLRGEWGGIELEVNGAGKITKVLGRKAAKLGKDITVTLDLDIQKAAEFALRQRTGAVVAIEPYTGQILAMASSPTFDPNFFSTPLAPKTWKQLQQKDAFLLNRVLQGFPPASTFKIVTSTAAMESGKYPPDTILSTSPYLSVGGTHFREWNRLGFGKIGYIKALALSSNTFHGQIGLKIGEDDLVRYARLYGFGSKTGIELEEEKIGLIADNIWKKKKHKGNWTDGDTVNMSLGQGFTKATPLQVAIMFSVIANGGYRIKPQLLKKVYEKEYLKSYIGFKSSTIRTLREGLRAVVLSGTGKILNVPSLPPVAGKSGTAEAPPRKSHAWFGGFAPYNSPEIVVVAFVEHSGGGGGTIAAPIVRQVMEAYFKHNRSLNSINNRKNLSINLN